MTPLLLSKRRGAKILGIGRDTLAELIAGGHIRTVILLGQVKIALEEIERFAREGTGPVAPKQVGRAPRRKRSRIEAVAAAVEALDF
jgi:hypothetical protein